MPMVRAPGFAMILPFAPWQLPYCQRLRGHLEPRFDCHLSKRTSLVRDQRLLASKVAGLANTGTPARMALRALFASAIVSYKILI